LRKPPDEKPESLAVSREAILDAVARFLSEDQAGEAEGRAFAVGKPEDQADEHA